MTERDYEIVVHVLLALSDLVGPRALRVVEWGSGKSTISLTARLSAASRAAVWLALDNDSQYVEKEVLPYLPGAQHVQGRDDTGSTGLLGAGPDEPAVTILSFDRGPLFPAQRGRGSADADADLDRYVEAPSQVFDFIDVALIDGRKRRRCLIEASKMIRGGVALLHDAYRTQYQCAFESFPVGSFVGDELWLGRMQTGPPLLPPCAYEARSTSPLTEVLSGWRPPSTSFTDNEGHSV